MKKSFYIIFGALIVLSLGLYKINQQELRLGDGQAPADVLFSADVGTANDPALKYDLTSGAWQFSNNGTDFAAMGSGGGFGTNHVQNPDFELNATDWATFADGAVSEPVDGTGGSATATFARTTTTGEIRRGSGSGKFSKDAADRQGEGFSAELTLDDQDLQHLLGISFEYKTTANYVDGDMGVWIICDTGGSPYLIAPQEGTGLPATGGGRGKHIVSFLAPTSDTEKDCRLSLMVTNTAALAYDVIVDDVIVGPGVGKTTPVATKCEPYTPTINNVTTLQIEGCYGRVGDEMIWRVQAVLSSVSGNIEFVVPNGLTIDIDRLNTPSTLNYLIGSLYARDLDTPSNSTTGMVDVEASGTEVIARLENGTTKFNPTTPFTWASSDQIALRVRIPIVEWENEGVTHLLDSDVPAKNARTVVSGISGTAMGTSPTETLVQYNSVETGTGYNTSNGEYTVPSDGVYKFEAQVGASGSRAVDFVWKVNGTQTKITNRDAANTDTEGTFTKELLKDDVVTLYVINNGSAANFSGGGDRNRLSVTRISEITAGTPIGFGISGEGKYGLIDSKDDYTVTASSTGHNPAASNVPFRFKKIQDKITMCMDGFNVGATVAAGFFLFSAAVPEEFRPSKTETFVVNTIEGNASVIGGGFVGTNGDVRFGATSYSDTFNGVTDNGVRDFCMNWIKY